MYTGLVHRTGFGVTEDDRGLMLSKGDISRTTFEHIKSGAKKYYFFNAKKIITLKTM